MWRSVLTLTLSLVLMLWVLQRYVMRPMTELTGAAEGGGERGEVSDGKLKWRARN